MGDVRVDDECIKAFKELKNRRIGYVIYHLDSNLENVEVKERGSLASHDEFLDKLLNNDAAYVAVDFHYSRGKDDAKMSKIILISWCPEGTRIKLRMVHSAIYNTLRQQLDGVQVYVQAADLSDVEYDELVSRC